MGALAGIANPDGRKMWRDHAGRSWRWRFRRAEQGIGSGAVGSSLGAVGCDARDLGFEAGDPGVEFCLRVGAEVLGSEAARCIALGPRQINLIHHATASQVMGLAVNP
jgi:hypothetical protein